MQKEGMQISYTGMHLTRPQLPGGVTERVDWTGKGAPEFPCIDSIVAKCRTHGDTSVDIAVFDVKKHS